MESIKGSFIFYKDWANVIRDLPAEVRLDVYDAVIEYALSGKHHDLKPMAKIAFGFIKQTIDRDTSKYLEVSEKRKEAGRAGASKRWQNETTNSKNGNCYDNENDNVNENDNARGEKSKIFIVPELSRIWYKAFPAQIPNDFADFPAINSIIEHFSRRERDSSLPDNIPKSTELFRQLIERVKASSFYSNKPLKTIASNIQNFDKDQKNDTGKQIRFETIEENAKRISDKYSRINV